MDKVHNLDRHLLLTEALSHVVQALDLCDKLGATGPACHLQLGFDLLHTSLTPTLKTWGISSLGH